MKVSRIDNNTIYKMMSKTPSKINITFQGPHADTTRIALLKSVSILQCSMGKTGYVVDIRE